MTASSSLSAVAQAERLTYLGVAMQASTKGLLGADSHSVSFEPPPSDALPGAFDEEGCTGNGSVARDVLPSVSSAAVEQLAGQLTALLSGQMQQQCQAVQVRTML